MAARQKIRSNQHARRRQDHKRRIWRFYTGLVVFCIALLIGITHWSAIQIQEVAVEVGEYVDAELIEELADNILTQPALGVISRKNIILAPWAEIRAKVEQISPRIKEVKLKLAGLRSLRIEVTEREAAARVCRQPTGHTLQGCHFIDTDSFVFSRADENSTTTSGFTYVVDTGLRKGEHLLPAADFDDLHSFIQALEDIHLAAELAYLEEYGDVTIRVTDATGREDGAVNLRVNLYDDLSQVLANLQTVIDNKSFVASTPTNGETPETISPFALEYVDLRFENKVFYK